MHLSPENQQWLDDFRARHGRSPRILHIGNIANNAYNNAKLMNEAGLDCDVICYDYYHVMGCPEWEDADLLGAYGNQFKPDWVAARVTRFERPRWFAQGPVLTCINYLIARRDGHSTDADRLWDSLSCENGLKSSWLQNILPKLRLHRLNRAFQLFTNEQGLATRIGTYVDSGPFSKKPESLRLMIAFGLVSAALLAQFALLPLRGGLGRSATGVSSFGSDQVNAKYDFHSTAMSLVDIFKGVFPSRKDVLSEADISPYQMIIPRWKRLFERYDLVQAYATDPILPLLSNMKPYIGFEHGTLRSHTLCDEPICRLTSLAYQQADHVFITNGDCTEYARKIGVTCFTSMLHPVDERRIESIAGTDLRGELGVKHVFLCTLRHDWAIKGTDQYIRALPDLVKALGRDFRVIMTRWGAELDQSIALAESLGVGDLILWSEPLLRRRLIQTLKSVDVLFDQLALPHFGATAPEGIAAGVPVIMSYDPRSTEWLVAKPAPILSAHTTAEIVVQVLQALDPAWLADYRQRAAKWFDAHHSSRLVVQGHLDVYRRLIPAH